MTAKKLFTARPDTGERTGEQRAKAALEAAPDARVYFLGPAKYAKGLKELKNMATNAAAEKNFIMEALDDLFAKYERGEGNFEVENVAELKRRLEGLR